MTIRPSSEGQGIDHEEDQENGGDQSGFADGVAQGEAGAAGQFQPGEDYHHRHADGMRQTGMEQDLIFEGGQVGDLGDRGRQEHGRQ